MVAVENNQNQFSLKPSLWTARSWHVFVRGGSGSAGTGGGGDAASRWGMTAEPHQTTGCIADRGESDRLAGQIRCIRFIAVGDGDQTAARDCDTSNIVAGDAGSNRDACRGVVRWQTATI